MNKSSEQETGELTKINVKLQHTASINTQLNDELNMKTEELCLLHSTNSKMSVENSNLQSRITELEISKSHVEEQLSLERKGRQECESLKAKMESMSSENDELRSKNKKLASEVEPDTRTRLSTRIEMNKYISRLAK